MPDSPRIDIAQRHLPYVDRLDERPLVPVDLVVMHCTELPDLATAREYGSRIIYASGTGNSGHYYVDRDGSVEQWIPDHRVAHHVRGHNANSVGIELVNTGRWPDWYDSRRQELSEPYPETQIDALIRLLLDLRDRLPALTNIVGHEELDRETVTATDDPGKVVRRKIDPGVWFPWPIVLSASGLNRLTTPD